ncbi:pentatricopeptide repeat-containing protein At3g29230-like [Punica granatum]|uniref:Uncharacterized protein n=2 Tax=Punica granatum TaxID=22663 RepID=A0A2I0I2F4_PUNGR|nr:pentatricopeptide repeat-containing protein At3g29230-like [Punica granatum]PKI38003.1 hypothetical protein CRG98_041599 [Punica granatum]
MPMSSSSRAVVLRLVCNLQSLKQVEQALASVTKQSLFSDPLIASKLIVFSALSSLGSLFFAQSIFEQTPGDNTFICNTMMRAYSRSAFPVRAIAIYNRMLSSGLECDKFSYNFVLKACGRMLWCGKDDVSGGEMRVSRKVGEVHCRVFVVGLDSDLHIQNSLLHMYSECGLMGSARWLFDEMTDRTVASWNIMILAFDQVGDFAAADELLDLMPRKNVVSWNTLIARYVRLGNVKAAERVFNEMPERDTVSWNSIISGYAQVKDYAEALRLFNEMTDVGVKATEITLTSVLGACAETGALDMGKRIHELLKEKGQKIEDYIGIALVDMYAKCGELTCARRVFDNLEMKPASCWNAMIIGLAVHGHSQEALKLFHEMTTRKRDDVRPNGVTFTGVLTACSHKGLVEEGRWLFALMTEGYLIKPDMKHYGCMVDLYSRLGLLDEAYGVIRCMPFEANCVIWRTLLGACRTHGNVELGELSFRQLAKLGTLRDGDYVLLSNMYADAGRWDAVERLRDEMGSGKVLRRPGASNIALE